MSKLISRFAILNVEEIKYFPKDGKDVLRMICNVDRSNFLEMKRCAFPMIRDAVEGLVEEGDVIKLTFFMKQGDLEEDEATTKMTINGMKVEVWNLDKEMWDKTYERFDDSGF